uniref:DUF1758 domain-containing protein n=1 Tax=Wuchereria bancrofti TaxID=6293 RepID=A0AAF5PMK1_WUCBA
MSSNIIASIQPAKERLVNLLQEINQLEFKSPDSNATIDQKENLYTILEDKLLRIQLCINTIQSICDEWRDYIRKIKTTKRKEEEENFLEITRGDQGIYQILHEDKEAIIKLTMHKDEADQKLIQLSKGSRKDEKGLNFPSKLTVNLLQLSLPTFNGDPKQWRQFWSSFDAAIHSQAIPDIQKLNYLYSCLKGNALQVVSGYNIVPENYGRYNPEKTSALSTIRSNPKVPQLATNKKRPCIFCNRDHWDSDCDDYPRAKTRMYRLKRLNKFSICFRDNHKGEACKVKKQCCKGSHNSALCGQRNIISSENMTRWEDKTPENSKHPTKQDSSRPLSNSICTTQTKVPGETLLLCRGINLFSPKRPQRKLKTLALFDIGTQLSFISRKLPHQLGLSESENQIMKISPFRPNKPKLCPTTSAQLGIQTPENEIIPLRANVIEYLTNEVQVVEILKELHFQDLTSNWKKPDILIGSDYFFKFIDLQELKELHSGSWHYKIFSRIRFLIV